MIGHGPLPTRMAAGSAARFLRGIRGVRLGRVLRRMGPAFELPLMQGPKLDFELLVFGFEFAIAALLLVELAMELSE